MAKWGEGDPRWIVEERADATNVNNWHWTEKNATPWSIKKLKSLLEDLVIDDEKYFCEIKELTKLEGEASANNRKAKLFFFYEWEIKADWKGRLKNSSKSHKGEIEIPNLSEEHTAESVDINVCLKENQSEEAFEVKEFLRQKGLEVIRRQLRTYISELKEEFSQGMILPTKDAQTLKSQTSKKSNTSSKTSTSLMSQGGNGDGKQWVEVQGTCKAHDESVDFKCQAHELYSVFLDKHKLEAFTQGPADVEPRKGGRFSLFGGNISGEFTDLVTNQKIEMKWRSKGWPTGHTSLVILQLDQREDCTILTLNQSGIPGHDFDRTVEGWRHYYWQSIKQTFGFGAMLF